MTPFFDRFSLPEIFVATVALTYLSIELGYRLGRDHRDTGLDLAPSVDALAGATAGLMAFMLAVTFGMANTRYDLRKQLVVKETNAIVATYLRAAFLPEPARGATRSLLRDYVDVRLNITQAKVPLAAGIEQSEALQKKLWEQASAAGQKNPGWITTGLFIQSLNEVIDVHVERLTAGVRNRLPWTSWAALYLLTVLTMLLMGYRIGLGADRSRIGIAAFVFAFSMVIFIIADLDRPQQGMIRISQQALIDVQEKLNREK